MNSSYARLGSPPPYSQAASTLPKEPRPSVDSRPSLDGPQVIFFSCRVGDLARPVRRGLIDPTPLPGDLDVWRHMRMYVVRDSGSR